MGAYSFTVRFDVDDVAPELVTRVMVAAVNALVIVRAVSTATTAGGAHDVLFQVDAAYLAEVERTSEVACMAIVPLTEDAYAFAPAEAI